MLVWRLNNCRSPTMGEKYVSPLSFSSGANSSLASLCGLLVIAPKSAHVVSLSAFTVRSGSALPSVHQNFQPMSHGTYSASNFIRSRTIRAASMTSFPTPSPGIHAILYLAIGGRLYRCLINPQATPAVFEPTTDYADGCCSPITDPGQGADRRKRSKQRIRIRPNYNLRFLRCLL